MNLSRYLEVREIVLANAKRIEDSKRKSYTSGNEDVLFNFKSDCEFVGTNQLQNCLTHLMKQVRGISSFVVNPDVEPSESLASRAADVINYACLMVANAEEMGRDTGLGYVNQRFYGPDPKVASTWLKRVEAEFAKVVGDHYDYNFGKDDV